VKGFSFIVFLICIAIAAIILTPLSFVVFESVTNSLLPEYYQIASSLLEGEVERVTNMRFSQIDDVAQTSYAGGLSRYSYRIDAEYVASGDLNTIVSPTVTDYKRIEITVSCFGFPDVNAVTVVTNN
jgi:hypothetical protein